MKLRAVVRLAACIAVSELAGIIGSVFTTPSIPGWYAALARPAFNPPNRVFGPVWTTLFALMGVALFLVWQKKEDRQAKKYAVIAFFVQLGLNTLWSILFFGLQSPAWAFVDIVALWFGIVVTMLLFYRISKSAAWLLLPYLLWVSFAGVLNAAIWMLN
jgi:benzodiazapine receptor